MSVVPLLRPLAFVGGLGALAAGAVQGLRPSTPAPQAHAAVAELGASELGESEIEIPAPPTVPDTPALTPRNTRGALSGLTVYLSAGHGYVAHKRGRGWQRPTVHGLTEDLYTARFVADALVPALERAGAVVLTPRERDRNSVLAFADDGGEGFVAEGAVDTEAAGSWSEHQVQDDLAVATAEGTVLEAGGRAAWTLTAPDDGTFQVYTSWIAAEDRDTAVRYTVLHDDGAEALVVDQTGHGDTWWPLTRVRADKGDEITIVVEGSGEGTVSANTVRMGGGTTAVRDRRTGERVVVPTWQVAAVHHLPSLGAPREVWAAPGGGFAGDAAARARWADWASPEGEDAVYVAIHTDAGGGRGTTALVRRKCYRKKGCDDVVTRSHELADTLRGSLVTAARQLDPSWLDRGTKAKALAEVSHHLNPRVPAALLELGFHDNLADARMLADDTFVDRAADSLVAGLIRWRGVEEEPALPPVAAAEPAWEGGSVRWDPEVAAASVHGPVDRWRVRARVAGVWTPPRFTSVPRAEVPPTADAVEILGVNEAGLGRPVLVERDGVSDR